MKDFEKIINPGDFVVEGFVVEDFRKVVNPGRYEVRKNYKVNVFCKIEFKDLKLSITGVIGPRRSGNCAGSCGQIDSYLKDVIPGPGWNKAKIKKFQQIWDEWHLNDMSPACEHQIQLGWLDLAQKKAELYYWDLRSTIYNSQKAIQKQALELVQTGQSVQLEEDDIKILGFPLSVTTTTQEPPSPEYEPSKSSYKRHVETKTLGWLYPTDHPDGILTKPCPVCGYKYGSAWVLRSVPDDVVRWLYKLPETTITPAWV